MALVERSGMCEDAYNSAQVYLIDPARKRPHVHPRSFKSTKFRKSRMLINYLQTTIEPSLRFTIPLNSWNPQCALAEFQITYTLWTVNMKLVRGACRCVRKIQLRVQCVHGAQNFAIFAQSEHHSIESFFHRCDISAKFAGDRLTPPCMVLRTELFTPISDYPPFVFLFFFMDTQ